LKGRKALDLQEYNLVSETHINLIVFASVMPLEQRQMEWKMVDKLI